MNAHRFIFVTFLIQLSIIVYHNSTSDITVCYVIICSIAMAYSMGQITRNSSGDEIANVNFLYDDIVHALKYNRLLH